MVGICEDKDGTYWINISNIVQYQPEKKILKNLNINPKTFTLRSTSSSIKDSLRKKTSDAYEKGIQPRETFYDGYVVNAILDAAYKSAKTKLWEPVQLDIWRGKTGLTKESHLVEYDADHYLVKEEMTHYGVKKLILKNKATGKISEQIIN